jgi:23S rRNA pseudouridine2605 synthase
MVRRDGRTGRRVQLHRAVAKLGWGSRTQAWQWICAGEVQVDGRLVTDPLTWVDIDTQHITRRAAEPPPRDTLVLALHKRRGVVTTRSDDRGRRTVYDLLPADLPWVFPAGRLDADSEGLLILTNDSALAVQLTDPEHRIPKTYHVLLDAAPTDADLDRLRRGVDLSDGRTKPAAVRRLGTATSRKIEVVLTEGRNRQIRRMAKAVGRRVGRLVRVAIGGLQLGTLASGTFRILDESDLALLAGGHAAR